MKRINLLPPEHRARASRERGLMYIIVAVVALVAVLGLVYYQQHSQVATKQAQLMQLQAQTAALTTQAAALQPYAQIEQMRSSLTQTTQSIYGSRVYWSTVFEEISLVIPDNVRLNTLNCTVPTTMLPGGTTSTASSTTSGTGTADVTFTGVTYTPDDVASFMTRLGLIPQLANVQLVSSTQSSSSQASTSTSSSTTASPSPTAAATVTWQFTVTAQLRSYLTAPPTTTLQQGAAQ
jgi:Tfp pilus assembly protein PilN